MEKAIDNSELTFDRNANVICLLFGQGSELHAQGLQVQPSHLLVQVLGQDIHLALLVLVSAAVAPQLNLIVHITGSPPSSSRNCQVAVTWARVWLVKEADMTKEGWPVAQPRFSRRPSASTMTPWPSGKMKRSTCDGTELSTFTARSEGR